jgi:hypothetical protein
MKAVLFNLFTVLSLTLAAQKDNVVLDFLDQCYNPLIAPSNNIDSNDNTLTMDEYKTYVSNLIQADLDKYGEVDINNPQISDELELEFGGLVELCPAFFNTTDTVAENCSDEEIHVIQTGDEDLSKAFLFTVCETSIEFLNKKIASDAPSLAPTPIEVDTDDIPTDPNNTPLVFGVSFGVVGALFLLIGWKTCDCKKQHTDLSEPDIEVEFPMPKLPREDEKVQLEQQIPIA